MSATLASDPWNQTVPVLNDGMLETVDGKDPGQYRRSDLNGYLLSRELTPEIAVALGSLSTPLLMRVVKMLKAPNTGSRISLIEAFQDAVIRSGVRLLVARLTRQILKKASQACNLSSPKQRLLLDTILRIGLPAFLHEKCDVPMFIEFCSVLGLDAGRPGLQLVPPTSSNHPNGPSNSNTSTSKTSTDLERELADEIMLLGTEDLLKTFPIPILQEMSQELGLLNTYQGFPPTDAFQLIDLIMDHIFDLVPFQEYTQLVSTSLVSDPKAQQTSPDSSKKRKREDSDPSTPTQSAKTTGTSANSNSSDSGSPSPYPSSPLGNTSNSLSTPHTHGGPHKKSKLSETANSETLHATSSSPISAHTSTTSPSKKGASPEAPLEMDLDSSSALKGSTVTEAKRPRGRPPSASKQQQTAATSSSSAMDITSPSVGAGIGSVGPTGVKAGRLSRHAPSSSPADESHHSLGSRRTNTLLTDEEEEEESGNNVSPLKRRGRPPSHTSAASSASTAASLPSNSSKKTASSQRGLYSHSKRGGGKEDEEGSRSSSHGGSGSGKNMEEIEEADGSDYEEGEESEEEEPVQRPSGKGRAKYQAPPLTNIKKGVTGQDLHNLYNVTDLQEWCRQHGVDHTGKKSAVIKRILYQLDPTNAKPPPPKKSRRFNSR